MTPWLGPRTRRTPSGAHALAIARLICSALTRYVHATRCPSVSAINSKPSAMTLAAVSTSRSFHFPRNPMPSNSTVLRSCRGKNVALTCPLHPRGSLSRQIGIDSADDCFAQRDRHLHERGPGATLVVVGLEFVGALRRSLQEQPLALVAVLRQGDSVGFASARDHGRLAVRRDIQPLTCSRNTSAEPAASCIWSVSSAMAASSRADAPSSRRSAVCSRAQGR